MLRRIGMQVLWHGHRFAYRISGGRAGGAGTLALHTVGRRSGEPRMTLLSYLPDGDRFVVVASNAGSGRDPAWWRNLEAKPTADIVVDGRRLAVHARRAEDPERARLWKRIVAWKPAYARYAATAGRPIPVVLLEPRAVREQRVE